MVEDHQLGVILAAGRCDLLQLSLTDEGAGVGCAPRPGDGRHGMTASRCDQLLKLQKTEIALCAGKLQLHKHGALTAAVTLKKHDRSVVPQVRHSVISLQLRPRRLRPEAAHYAQARR